MDLHAPRPNALSKFEHSHVGFSVSINNKYIQGVPKKIRISVSQAVEGLESGLEIKVGSVLENSGFFLSNEYKNFSLLSKNSWENQGQTCLPPSKKWHYLKSHCNILCSVTW